jgi:hypothetical protein
MMKGRRGTYRISLYKNCGANSVPAVVLANTGAGACLLGDVEEPAQHFLVGQAVQGPS